MLAERYFRLLNPKDNHLSESIKLKPELYGPFWVNTALVVLLFTFGNISDVSSKIFKYELLSLAVTTIYSYLLFIPLLLSLLMRFQGVQISIIQVE